MVHCTIGFFLAISAHAQHGGESADGGCGVVDISASAETLYDAQSRARALLTAGAPCVVISLGARSYRLSDPLVLTAADSNTRWVGGEITSAVPVPMDAWQTEPDSDSVTVARTNISALVNATLWGHVDMCPGCLIGPAFLTLNVQTGGRWRPMTLARWPNIPFDFTGDPPVNWTTIKSVDCPSPAQEPDGCAPQSVGVNCSTVTIADDTDRPLRWVAAAEEGRLGIHGFFRYLWKDSRVPITRVDPLTRQLHTNASFGTYGVTNDSFWYAYNLIEELDNPGEFVLNYTSGILSAVFPEGCVVGGRVVCPTQVIPAVKSLNIGQSVCGVGNCSSSALVRVINAHNVTFEGLTVSGSQGAAIGVFGSTNVVIDSCNISSHKEGVVVGGTQHPLIGSQNVSLFRSEIAYIGYTASVWSGGNRSLLEPSQFLIENNRFHDFGMWTYTYTPGVIMAGVAVTVRKNEFRSSYHAALLFSGNEHLVELNTFHHVTTVGYDSGTIYTGRDLSSRGTVIRHNLFHSLDNHATCNAWTSCSRNAIYIDDLQESVTVTGNIFYDVDSGFFSNCGGFMNFSNNLFVDCQFAVRQAGSAQKTGPAAAALYATLSEVPFRDTLWQERYRGLQRFANWTVPTAPPPGSFDGPLQNVYATNLVVNLSQAYTWEQCACCPLGYHYGDIAHRHWSPGYPPGSAPNDPGAMFVLASAWANSTAHFELLPTNRKLANPGFVSATPGQDLNFALLPTSPMWELGWQAIPENDIGPDT